jgi:hypothetical protein
LVNLGTKNQILRKASVTSDCSLSKVSLALLEVGEVIGLEEC